MANLARSSAAAGTAADHPNSGPQSKNNPVLVGEAGVGKTAVVEALAVRIIDGKDPEVLADKRIVELNLGALTGGHTIPGRIRRTTGKYPERSTDTSRGHPLH